MTLNPWYFTLDPITTKVDKNETFVDQFCPEIMKGKWKKEDKDVAMETLFDALSEISEISKRASGKCKGVVMLLH
jgi:hypothetical protein